MMIQPVGSVAEYHVSIVSDFHETATGGKYEPGSIVIEGQGGLSPINARALAALIGVAADAIDRAKERPLR